MEVILLEKIRNLGSLGEKVKVKTGYGRNYLVPFGKAVYATPENMKSFEAKRAELEARLAEVIKVAETRKQALLALGVITIQAKAGEEGRLFGSIGTRDIAQAVTEAGVEVHKSEIHLPEGALRHVGEYNIDFEFHSDVMINVKIILASEASASNSKEADLNASNEA